MVAKTLLLSCLLWVPGQASQPAAASAPWYVNETNFKVPVRIPPQRQQTIKQVMLYVSDDEGKNWRQYASAPPSQDHFVFRAEHTGTFGFRVVVINRDGRQEPENIFGPPNLITVVDTTKPKIDLVTERFDDEVVVRWNIAEANPDIKSMKLQFQSKNSPTPFWSPVPISLTPTGEARFKVEDPNALTVRMQLKDLAKNLTIQENEVASVVVNPPEQITQAQGTEQGNPNLAPVPVPVPNPAPVVTPMPLPQPNPPALTQEQPTQLQPEPINSAKVKQKITEITPKADPQPAEPKREVASTQNGAPQGQSTYHKVEMKPREPLPPVQIVNSTELSLKYQLNNVGPAGVSKAILYITHNDGQEWKMFAEDESVAKDPTLGKVKHNMTYERTVRLPGEGVFGLMIRVWREFDHRELKPASGDVPEMRIEVDQTAPEAVLYAPRRDNDRKDSLLITWAAKDRNLHPNPITLEWAREPNGPWETIQTNLPNNGSYAWQIKPGMPAYAYLRLKVLDLARNEGVAVTQDPQLIDLSEPKGKLLAVTVSGGPH